jgi:hypothetical protein
MKRNVFLIFFFLISYQVARAEVSKEWLTAKSRHFIVYYQNADERFINQLIDKSEDYYDSIALNLGFTRYDFWLWDNRAKIYIYDNAEDYQKHTGQPAWSFGSVSSRDKIISAFPTAQGFFDTILPHELGHIIFREFVGFDNPAVPLWLEEGVASYQGFLRKDIMSMMIKQAIKQEKFISLVDLSIFSPAYERDTEKVNLFYAEVASIVDYLIKEFGKENFVVFCQNLRDKKDLARALTTVYPFLNIKQLDLEWQEYLNND